MLKVILETLEKGVKYVFKIKNKDTRTTLVTSFWCLHDINFEHVSQFFSSVAIVDFQHVYVCWGFIMSTSLVVFSNQTKSLVVF